MAQGAYENPRAFGVDFSEGFNILQQGAQSIAASMKDIADQRKEARRQLEEDFAEFKDLTYVDKLQGVNEGINNAIRESAANFISLADFSTMSPSEKQNAIMTARDAKAGRDAIGLLIESAQNNVLDPRIDPQQSTFVLDLMNGRNLEYKPSEDGVSFIIEHSYTNPRTGETVKNSYDSAKLAMMVNQFQDIEPVFEGIEGSMTSTASSLQKKRELLTSQFGEDLTENDYLVAAESLFGNMQLRDKELYYAEYVNEGADLVPRIEGLSQEERDAIRASNEQELKNYIANELKSRTSPSRYQQPKPSYEEQLRMREESQIRVNKATSGLRDDNVSDEALYNNLEQLRKDFLNGQFNPKVRKDILNFGGYKFGTGGRNGDVVIHDVVVKQEDGTAIIIGKQWDAEQGKEIRTNIGEVNLNDPNSINVLYENILKATKGGNPVIPKGVSVEKTEAQRLIEKYSQTK